MVQAHPDSRLFQEAPFRFLTVARVQEGDSGDLFDSAGAAALPIVHSLIDGANPALTETALDGVAPLEQLRWAEHLLEREVTRFQRQAAVGADFGLVGHETVAFGTSFGHSRQISPVLVR